MSLLTTHMCEVRSRGTTKRINQIMFMGRQGLQSAETTKLTTNEFSRFDLLKKQKYLDIQAPLKREISDKTIHAFSEMHGAGEKPNRIKRALGLSNREYKYMEAIRVVALYERLKEFQPFTID